MPFRLNGPATFMRYIHLIFRYRTKSGDNLYKQCIYNYKMIEKNLKILKQALYRMKAILLELGIDKCSFLQQKLDYSVSKNEIRSSKKNVNAISDFTIPQRYSNLHRIRSRSS
ncbi:hypothetical protein AMK59_8753 [Oryctes borbonicus]|uniref:Uncharacterized protein n=1 Tax=Oryctes borbonicus TaxID=1629725 RepID=A0A0T6AUJ0_9SCAR|nr:hypothetical protein AMK59_8753 [Oryctes borbonicus]